MLTLLSPPPQSFTQRERERHGKSSLCKASRKWKLWRNLWSTSKLYSLFAQRARLSTQERVVFLPPEGGPRPSEEAILWPSVKQTQVMISSFSEWVLQLLKGQAPPQWAGSGARMWDGDSAGNSSFSHATQQKKPRGSPSHTSLRGERPHLRWPYYLFTSRWIFCLPC